MNCSSAKSPLGLLKLLITALLISIVLLSYYGNEGGRLYFGLVDYLGIGVTVCFSLVVPLIFLTYLCDGNILIFECLISLIGSCLFLVVCIITYNSYSHPTYGAPAGKILATLCGIVATLLAINTVLSAVTLRK